MSPSSMGSTRRTDCAKGQDRLCGPSCAAGRQRAPTGQGIPLSSGSRRRRPPCRGAASSFGCRCAGIPVWTHPFPRRRTCRIGPCRFQGQAARAAPGQEAEHPAGRQTNRPRFSFDRETSCAYPPPERRGCFASAVSRLPSFPFAAAAASGQSIRGRGASCAGRDAPHGKACGIEGGGGNDFLCKPVPRETRSRKPRGGLERGRAQSRPPGADRWRGARWTASGQAGGMPSAVFPLALSARSPRRCLREIGDILRGNERK